MNVQSQTIFNEAAIRFFLSYRLPVAARSRQGTWELGALGGRLDQELDLLGVFFTELCLTDPMGYSLSKNFKVFQSDSRLARNLKRRREADILVCEKLQGWFSLFPYFWVFSFFLWLIILFY